MRNAIRDFLDLSYTPTWPEILMDFAGAAAVFAIPVTFMFWMAAFSWGR
jgi:hypothetical protein